MGIEPPFPVKYVVDKVVEAIESINDIDGEQDFADVLQRLETSDVSILTLLVGDGNSGYRDTRFRVTIEKLP